MSKKEFQRVSRALLAFIVLTVLTIAAAYKAHVNLFGSDVNLEPFTYVFFIFALVMVGYIGSVVWKKAVAA